MSNARKLADNLPTEGSLSGRNLVINGAMQVAQRGTSTTGIGASSVFGSVDRFQVASGTTGRVTMAQDNVTDLAGFTKCIKISCTTARTPSASELMFLRYAWEGHDLQRISKGTASAKPTKISFYVKASGVFNMACELYDADNNRHISQLFATSTSWNRIELDIPADTTGAYGDDNGAGLLMQLWFHGGTDRTSGTLPSTWATKSSNTNQAAGISNFLSSTSNELYFTGLQMEVGSQSTPFEHRSFGDELARCQRYTYVIGGSGVTTLGGGTMYNSTAVNIDVHLPVQLRTSPSFTTVANGTGNWLNVYVGATGTTSNATPQNGDGVQSSIRIYATGAHSGSSPSAAGAAIWCMVLAGAKLIINAEL